MSDMAEIPLYTLIPQNTRFSQLCPAARCDATLICFDSARASMASILRNTPQPQSASQRACHLDSISCGMYLSAMLSSPRLSGPPMRRLLLGQSALYTAIACSSTCCRAVQCAQSNGPINALPNRRQAWGGVAWLGAARKVVPLRNKPPSR